MSASSDPADALRWALDHVGLFWWVLVAIAVGINWTQKRMRDWNARNADPAALAARAQARAALIAALSPAMASRIAAAARATPAPPPAAPQPPPAPAYAAPASYAAAAYTAQPAYAAPPTVAPPAVKSRRQAPPVQRAVTPVGRSVDVPAAAPAPRAWNLMGMFDDPAHARSAIVIAEVLGPPVGLR